LIPYYLIILYIPPNLKRMRTGPKGIYDPKVHPRQARLMAMEGLTDKRIAEVWGIHESTLSDWKCSYPEFLEELKNGSTIATLKVVEHFFLNCIDRYVDIEEIHMCKNEVIRVQTKRFIQGDKWAQSRWLALKDRENWSETHGLQNNTTNILNIMQLDLSCLTAEELKIINKAHQHQIMQNNSNE
jgi:hypothetical protein